MKLNGLLGKFLVLTSLFVFANWALAESKTLIEMKDGKPAAGLAKSWKKVGDGKYEFVLDTNAKIKDTPLTPDIVKKSLEEKMGSSNAVTVTPKGKDTVVVAFSGDENAFLEGVGKARIRAGENVQLALESSVSEGGIRANTADRDPLSGEVKGTVLKVSPKGVDIRVIKASKDGTAAQIKEGSKISISTPTDVKVKKNDTLYFMPEKTENGVWKVTKATTN